MTIIKRLGLIGVVAASAAALGGCYDDYGYGPAVGYGAGYDGYYDGYGYADGGYYPGYFGWYGGYYYPGSGIYVYDRYRRPIRWNGDQRRYWSGQQRSYRGGVGNAGYRGNANWNGFNRGGVGAGATPRPAGQAFRRTGGGHTGGYHGGGGNHGGSGGHHR